MFIRNIDSAIDGLSTTKEIVARCQELGIEACGLSDHGGVTGHLDFASACDKGGVKPVFAAELYHGVKPPDYKFAKGSVRDQAHFLAGAISDEGLKNLWRLVDMSASYFRHVPRVSWEMLEANAEGMFATSACISGLVCQEIQEGVYDSLNRYLQIYRDNFFIELHTYPGERQEAVNQALVNIALERGVPTLIASDSHFAFPDQYEYHDAYIAMQTKGCIYDDPNDRRMWHPKSLYIQSPEEIKQNLAYLPPGIIDESFQNSFDLNERITATLPEVRRHLPVFIPKECPWLDTEKTAGEVFIDLVEEGLYRRYGDNPSEEVWNRAEQEMEIFLQAGLEHYFLQTWDFCRFCDENDIKRGPGRGSSAGAIVAYALGITDIDPLYYGLIFERFYNPGREKGFPDIDNDFPKGERKRVREYLIERWGEKRVKVIGNISRMKPKAACDASYIACGVTWKECQELKDLVDEVPDIDILGPDSVGWSEATDPDKTVYVLSNIGNKIAEWLEGKSSDRQDVLLKWLDVLEHICSRVSHYGVHASGIVVSDVDLDTELPGRWSVDQKVPVTCFAMTDVDARQFVKQDILGLRNLDTLAAWEKLAAKNIEWSGLEFQDHPDEMWEMLDRGLTQGIFQIEEGYARQLCKQLKPRSVMDLATIVALNRPGPIRAKTPDAFIRRHQGKEAEGYDHPILEDVLDTTYGLFLTQEQVIRFFSKLGYSLGEADAVRKILGKKKPEEMQNLLYGRGEWKGKGYLEIAEKELADEPAALEIWNKIEGFAAYSFNLSHAVAYATLAFRTLYAKYTDPASFLVACIQTNPDAEKKAAYINEGRRLGIDVFPPDIEYSDVGIQVVDGVIYFGFADIKGVGLKRGKELISLRDKHGFRNPEQMFEAIAAEQKIWEEADKEKRTKTSPRQRLPQSIIPLLTDAGVWDRFESRKLSLAAKQQFEKDLFSVILTDNTQEIFEKNQSELANCDKWEAVEGAECKLPGVISNIKERRSRKSGQSMGIITIEYEGDEVEFVVFPQHWTSYKFMWKENTPGIFDLKRNDRGIHMVSAKKLF